MTYNFCKHSGKIRVITVFTVLGVFLLAVASLYTNVFSPPVPTVKEVQAQTNIGYTEVGGYSIGSFNRFRVSRITVPAGVEGKVYEGRMHIAGNRSSSTVYMIAYAGSGTSAPTTLLGQSNRILVPVSQPAQWVTFTFPFPFSVSAGQDIWLGLYADGFGTAGGTSGPLLYYTTSVIGDYADDGYRYGDWGAAPMPSIFPPHKDTTYQMSWSAYLVVTPVNTRPTITLNPSASYGSYTRTGPNNTPFTVSFTATDAEQTGPNQLKYYIHTGPNRTGTQVATGKFTSGVSTNVNIAYNAPGMINNINTLYLSVYDGLLYSTQNPSFTVLRDDNPPGASTNISHTPNPVTGSKQYSVTFTPNDDLSTNVNEMAYQIRTAAGGGGTLLTSGFATSGTSKTTATFPDSGLINGANTRYVRTRDGANNWTDTQFTVTFITVPTLTSPTHSSVTSNSAVLGATITSDGGAPITQRGTCWGTSPNPTTNCLAEGGTAIGTFSHFRTGLPAGTLIYYRGYADNSVGRGYSPNGTFTTLASFGVVLDGATKKLKGSAWSSGTGLIYVNCLNDPVGCIAPGVQYCVGLSGFGCGPPPSYNLTVINNPTYGGTITASGGVGSDTIINCGLDCRGTYLARSTVTLTATANIASGYTFSFWSGACSGTNPTTSVVINVDKSCTANYHKRR